VERYIKRNGIEYLREKITLTELEPRENAARYFMAALRDDFKLPVRREPEKEAASEASHPTFLGGAATSNGRGADSENGDDARTPPEQSRLSELKMQWISMLRVETPRVIPCQRPSDSGDIPLRTLHLGTICA
jgi:hypothetical protein